MLDHILSYIFHADIIHDDHCVDASKMHLAHPDA